MSYNFYQKMPSLWDRAVSRFPALRSLRSLKWWWIDLRFPIFIMLIVAVIAWFIFTGFTSAVTVMSEAKWRQTQITILLLILLRSGGSSK